MDDKIIEISRKLKLLSVIDPHGADKNPGARVGDYRADFFDKFDQIKAIAEKNKVDAIVVTGDIFSAKEKLKNSHTLTSTLSEKLLNMPCPVIGVLGNHDLYQNRLDSWESQPVSVLVKSGALKVLDWGSYIFDINGYKVKVRGASYSALENENSFEAPRGEEDLLVHVSHAAVCPDGGTYDKYGEKMLSYKDLSKCPPDIFILGHIHTDYGITEKFDKVYLQHGSLMRSTTHCYNLERDVKVGLIEITKSSVKTKEIKLKTPSSVEIFDLAKKQRIEEETKQLEELLVSLEGTLEDAYIKHGDEVEIETLFEELKVEGVDPKEVSKLYRYYMEKSTK